MTNLDLFPGSTIFKHWCTYTNKYSEGYAIQPLEHMREDGSLLLDSKSCIDIPYNDKFIRIEPSEYVKVSIIDTPEYTQKD